MTSDKMKRLIATNATVALTVNNGGDVEDCCVALAESLDGLMRREMDRIRNGAHAGGITPTDDEREAIEKAAVAYARRCEDGVGLLNDGPKECGEIAATLRSLLERLG